MQGYQITRLGRRGERIGTVSVLAPDDDFARLSAKAMLGPAVTVEIWQDRRFVGALPQREGAQAYKRFTDMEQSVVRPCAAHPAVRSGLSNPCQPEN